MKRAGIFAVMAVMITVMASSSYCQENPEGPEIESMQGEVSQIDWVGPKIAVRWVGEDFALTTDSYKETFFLVTGETKVSKGAEEYSFSDIQIADNVTVEYYIDNSGSPTAVSINVNE